MAAYRKCVPCSPELKKAAEERRRRHSKKEKPKPSVKKPKNKRKQSTRMIPHDDKQTVKKEDAKMTSAFKRHDGGETFKSSSTCAEICKRTCAMRKSERSSEIQKRSRDTTKAIPIKKEPKTVRISKTGKSVSKRRKTNKSTRKLKKDSKKIRRKTTVKSTRKTKKDSKRPKKTETKRPRKEKETGADKSTCGLNSTCKSKKKVCTPCIKK